MQERGRLLSLITRVVSTDSLNLAIDGNTDGRWASKSVTHTAKTGKDAWWRLDFSQTYHVSKISIWNRVDCCSERLNGVTVRVDDVASRGSIYSRVVTINGYKFPGSETCGFCLVFMPFLRGLEQVVLYRAYINVQCFSPGGETCVFSLFQPVPHGWVT